MCLPTSSRTASSSPATASTTAFGGGGCFQPDPNAFSDFLGSSSLQPGSYNTADYAPPAVDTLLTQGVATSNPAQRFTVYSRLFARLQADEPYIGLFQPDFTAALSSKFAYIDFSQWYNDGPWALSIKPAALPKEAETRAEPASSNGS